MAFSTALHFHLTDPSSASSPHPEGSQAVPLGDPMGKKKTLETVTSAKCTPPLGWQAPSKGHDWELRAGTC